MNDPARDGISNSVLPDDLMPAVNRKL